MTTPTAIQLVDQQLYAFGQRDINNFCDAFHHDVKMYLLGNEEPIFDGLDQAREHYTRLFNASPNLQAKLMSRTVKENCVIDYELITGRGDKPDKLGIAIYKVSGNKISTVWFVD
mgnify:CR=1 FL=1